MARTELFVQKQSGGMFIVKAEDITTGNIFFVDSATGTDGAGYGRNPDAPFATITYAALLANAFCTANNGDYIYVMPGHAETVGAAGGFPLDTAGITIKGLGHGTMQPTITLDTANTADIDIDAANITIKNINFVANFADIAIAIDVNATDFTLDSCRFTAAAANMNFLVCVEDALLLASNRLTIKNCYHLDRDATNTHFVNCVGTGDGYIITGNTLMGDYGTICIGGAGVVTNIVIADNMISNAAAVNDSCINLAAATTGIVVRNLCGSGAAVVNGVTATACTIAENYYQLITADLSGVLDPANA